MDFALSSDAIAIIGILALMMIAMVGGYISLVRRIASLPTRDEFNALVQKVNVLPAREEFSPLAQQVSALPTWEEHTALCEDMHRDMTAMRDEFRRDMAAVDERFGREMVALREGFQRNLAAMEEGFCEEIRVSIRESETVAFLFRWFGYKTGVQCPPYLPPEMRRYGTAGPPGNPTGTPNLRPTASRPPTSPG